MKLENFAILVRVEGATGQLVICEPNYPRELDIVDHCEEIIPEGGDHFDIPQAILDAADALNKAIRESQSISWSGGDLVAIVSDDILNDEQKTEILAERTNQGGDHE